MYRYTTDIITACTLQIYHCMQTTYIISLHVHYRYIIIAYTLDISSMYVQYIKYHIIACTLQVFYHYMYTTNIIPLMILQIHENMYLIITRVLAVVTYCRPPSRPIHPHSLVHGRSGSAGRYRYRWCTGTRQADRCGLYNSSSRPHPSHSS